MTDLQRTKVTDYALITSLYFLTFFACIVVGHFLPLQSALFNAAVLDVLATLLIFGFSVWFNNSSMYDPYWSVAPIAFIGYWVFSTSLTLRSALILLLVTLWGARLTINFLRRWRGMGHEDWRYANFREAARKRYWVVSFFGFHFFPTVIVFAAAVPIYYAVTSPRPFNPIDAVAAAVTLAAIMIEAVSDKQMRRHVLSTDNPQKTFRGGLWAYSRHPNYFGEILFWWGMYLFATAADPTFWWTIFGPAGVTVLFTTISLPLIEKRMKKRHPDFARVQKEISILVPWFPKSK